jgi:hypothetical protein
MLFSPVYAEAHPRRIAAFASRMNLRDAAHATTGYSVCNLVTLTTPTEPTDTLYLFSFQSLAEPCSPSRSHGTPFISFNFILLRTLSLTTDGYTPLPTKKVPLVLFTPICEGSEAEECPVFSALPTFQDPACPDLSRSGREPLGEIRPGRSRSSLFADHQSRVTYSFRINTCKGNNILDKSDGLGYYLACEERHECQAKDSPTSRHPLRQPR